MDQIKSQVNKGIFLVLPLTVFPIGPNIHDVHGILRLIGLLIGTSILTFANIDNLKINKKIQLLPWMLPLAYLIIQVVLQDDIQQFLLGSYLRNGGFIALICYALIFNIVSNHRFPLSKVFSKYLIFTLYGLLLFGFLEKFSLLPFTIKSNYEGALALTLVNPNFASAFVAIGVSVFFVNFFLNTRKIHFQKIVVLLLLIYLLFQTGSLQGLIIIVLNIILISVYKRSLLISLYHRKKVLFFITASLFSIFAIFNARYFLTWIGENGSVIQRLNYWRLSFKIWSDNIFTGVGLENLRYYAPRYRSEELVKQEGIFTNPDRSHNVFLDHFVNGGVFTGLIWASLVVLISFFAARKLIRPNTKLEVEEFSVVIVWFSYVVQSAISVDHLALTLLGYISGAIIINNNFQHKSVKTSIQLKPLAKLYVKIILIPAGVASLIFLCLVVRFEFWALDVTARGKSTYLENIYSSKIVVPQTLEDVAVDISQAKNFELADKFANKLLTHRPSSHQAYYMRAVYLETSLDFLAAREQMLKALQLDPYNSVYLLGMAIYEYKLNDLESAKEYLAKAKRINPNQKGLDLVSEFVK